jgi:hypothetical protein
VHFELSDGGGELVLDGSNVSNQSQSGLTDVQIIAAFGIAALVIRFLRS